MILNRGVGLNNNALLEEWDYEKNIVNACADSKDI